MILTEDTSEQDSFFTLFNDCVDSVTVTQIQSENIQDLTTEDQIVRNRHELGIDDLSQLLKQLIDRFSYSQTFTLPAAFSASVCYL